MTTVTVTSQIAAPVEKTFAMFTDIEHATEHVSGIKEVEMLTPFKFGLGTRWRETREVLVADPLYPNPLSETHEYLVSIDRVVCA